MADGRASLPTRLVCCGPPALLVCTGHYQCAAYVEPSRGHSGRGPTSGARRGPADGLQSSAVFYRGGPPGDRVKLGETPMRVVVAVVAVFGLAAHAAPVGETRQLQTAGYGIGGVPGISPSAKTDYAVQRGQLMKWRAHMRDWYCAKEQTDKFKNEKTFPCMIQTYLNQVKAETSEADKKEMVEEHKRYMQSVKAAAPVLPKHPCRRAGGSTNHPHFGRPARAGRRDNEEAACAGVLGHVQCVLR